MKASLRLWPSLLLIAGAVGCSSPSLETELKRRVAQEKDAALVEIAFENLKTGAQLAINAAEPLHAGSTMKLPVMMEVYRLVGTGALRLDEPMKVENKFRSLVDGSEFTLEAADDGDPWPYTQLGKQVPLSKLVERMIVRSSNLATNLIIQKVGAESVTKLCRSLGANEIQVLRGVEDGKAFAAGMNNTTSARDLLTLLRAIYQKKVPGADDMLEILKHQEFNEGIPTGLPSGTVIAHKTGSLPRFYHDAALVLPSGDPYLLVVMTKGFPDEKPAARLVGDLSKIVYRHVQAREP